LVLAAVILLAATAQADGFYRQDPFWTYNLKGKVNSLLTQNDSVLVGSESGIYSIDYDKNLRWFYSTSSAVTALEGHNSIIAAESDGTILLVNSSGGVIWERQVPGYVGYDQAIDIFGEEVVCGSMDGFIYAFDTLGAFKWKHLIGSYVTNVKIVNDTIIAVSDQQVYLMDLDGRVRRNLGLSGFVHSSAIMDNMITVAMDDGHIYSFDIQGKPMWTSEVGEYVDAMDAHSGIVVGTKEGHLMLLREDGKMLWKMNLTSDVIAVKTDGENILASTADGKVELYNIAGSMRWYYEPEGKATTLAINGRNMMAATSTGKVYYSRLIKRDSTSSFMISTAVVALIGAAILMVWKSWR